MRCNAQRLRTRQAAGGVICKEPDVRMILDHGKLTLSVHVLLQTLPVHQQFKFIQSQAHA
jgi:hypothetical protein